MYDDICKFIAENFSQDLAQWLLGEKIDFTVIEPTELQVAPIRADSVIFLESKDDILHIEFQTDPKENIPFRMADYRLRFHRIFPGKRIYQVVIYLRKTNSELARQTTFDLPQLHHEYNVIRLWEVPTEELLSSPGLLPFAVLSKTENCEEVLEKVAKQIETISDETEKVNITATSAILAGLVLDKMIIRRLLREEIMKESVIYQEIESIAEARGKAEGITIGEARGEARGEANLILRQLQRRFGKISEDLTETIRQLSLEKLDSLGESLLDFESIADLVSWLNNQ